MNSAEYIVMIPTLTAKLVRLQEKAEELQTKLSKMDVAKYRTAGIIDQLILQINQAVNGDDLYTALEADFSDTKLVWE